MVVKKLAAIYKDAYMQEIWNKGAGLTEQEAEALFYFQINGCFAVSKRYSNLKTEEWCPVQSVIDQFIKGGINSIPLGPA